MSKNSIIVAACLDWGAGNSFFFNCASDCNDPDEGGQEGGRGVGGGGGNGEEMGSGRKERQGWGNREG